MEPLTVLRAAGLLGVLGALLYIVGDARLLAVKPAPDRHPRLAPHAAVVGSMAKLAEFDDRRIVTGGLVGVPSPADVTAPARWPRRCDAASG